MSDNEFAKMPIESSATTNISVAAEAMISFRETEVP
jgi:hypothetical protein